ncbi:MAG: PAS domain S-box protein [bacterium]|nr:PAS domain S-box protein [bacterium]
MIREFWQNIVNIGVEPGMSERDIQNEVVTNKFILAAIAVGIFFMIPVFIVIMDYGYYSYLYLQLWDIVSMTAVLFIKKRFGRVVVVNIVVLLLTFYFFCLFIFAGESTGYRIIYICFMTLPYLVLKRDEMKTLLFCLFWGILSIAVLQYWFANFEPFFPVNWFFLKVVSNTYFYLLVAVIILLNYISWRHSNMTEKKLEAEREKSNELLRNTIPKIKQAEKRYRHLVENSHDIIFSLDEDYKFITVNSAMKRYLGIVKTEELLETPFIHIIHKNDEEGRDIFSEIVASYLDDLVQNKSNISFKAPLKSSYNLYPKDFSIKLEYTESEGEVEILGKGSLLTDDKIIKFLEAEKQTYTINNYLSNIDLLSQKLTVNLSKYLEASAVNQVRLSLREVMINALEHGNLSLSFEEKTGAMQKGNYFKFIQKQQDDSRNQGKNIMVEYTFNENRAAYRVTDEGHGFDHNTFMASLDDISGKELLPHGRGLLMIRETFDYIRFNEKGNQVLLIKYFNENKEQLSPGAEEPLFIIEDSFSV